MRSLVSLKRVLLYTVLAVSISSPVLADNSDRSSIINDTVFYSDKKSGASCNGGDVPASTNLPAAVIDKINAHKAVYVQAASAAGIPWQMLAALHYREAGLGTTVTPPTAKNGMYQILGKDYGLTVGAVLTSDQFLLESTDAANFLKHTVSSNLASHQMPLTTAPDPEEVKDTFFSYNGRSSEYAAQAAKLGFDPKTQPYEGSPYVMNQYDGRHQDMGIITHDHGSIDGTDNRFGAFTLYARLGGSVGTVSSCSALGQTGNKIADLALAEVGTIGYSKYIDRNEDWCADFVSWILKQAGTPFAPNANIPAVIDVEAWFQAKGVWVPNSTGASPPQVGDILIHTWPGGGHHTNIVVAVSGNKITAVGGNQPNLKTGEAAINSQTEVTKATYDNYHTDGSITGWGRMK